MNTNFRNTRELTLILLLTTSGLAEGRAANVSENEPVISVLVHNYAEIPAKTLIEAEEHAARILRRAGVGLRWLNCPGSQAEISRLPACARPEGGPTQLQLRVIPRTMAERLSLPNNAFGVALSAPQDQFGVYAFVFAHRVDEIAEQVGAEVARLFFSPAVILGHIMAHEMGHLLLGAERHSRNGIMSANWSEDAKLASRGELLFTRTQGKRIRAHVLDRIRAEEDQQRTRLESVLSSVQADPEPEVEVPGSNFAQGNGKFSAAANGS